MVRRYRLGIILVSGQIGPYKLVVYLEDLKRKEMRNRGMVVEEEKKKEKDEEAKVMENEDKEEEAVMGEEKKE
ncbi:hypothetical protein BHE74_00046878 [Ensete ventricosum]|nr:hypothetical protein BHE74_00046878 [Ensete ventricosum]